jgi:parvulin-like peptidyl-prolyl isomerase
LSNLAKGLAVIAVILAIGVGLVVWKVKVGGHGNENLTKLTKEDMTALLADANPMQLQQMASNPEAKKKIAENIRQLLAVASQARKEGMANDPNVKLELDSTRSIVAASLYDKHINKDKGQMPPFGFITEEQVTQFWGENTAKREADFQQFLDSKIALAKESKRFPEDKTLTEEEIKQAKDDYAKIKIYEAEAESKKNELGEEFNRNLELQIKLQQAQFLASRYANKTLVEKVKVTDEDIKKYIAEHPEYSTADKKASAEQILSRVKAGEDFAKLAEELSQDPGTKGKGGLYEGVTKGKMVPEFEQAALALQPGGVAENLVETPYGYHIIKLEKKGEGKDPSGQPAETYDVRHILITTTMKDPKNPMGREMPINETVKGILEEEKQKAVLDEIVANNPVEVPEDFEIPKPSEEDMKQMQQQMMQQQQQMPMQMPEGMEEEPTGKPASNTAPKKK